LLAVFAIGSAALMARVGLSSGMSAVSLSAWRLTIASACLLAFRPLGSIRHGKGAPGGKLILAMLAGAFLGLHFIAWIGSLEYVSVARSTLLVSTAPLWAGLAGLFLPGLRPRGVFWIGLGLALLGSWAITSRGVAWHDPRHAWIGDLLALAGAVCLVPYLLISQHLQRSFGWLATISLIYAAAAVFVWAMALAAGTESVPTSWQAWGSVLGMALFAQLVGHSGLNWSLKHFSAGQVALFTLLEPVFAGLLAWMAFGEPITAWQGVGGAVLLAGVGVALSGEAGFSGGSESSALPESSNVGV
jgi:drug/metabolite transporter (DMT)-like permease